MKHIYTAAAAFFVGANAQSLYGESDLNHTCIIEPAYLSCSVNATSEKADTCCTETFGGLVLQTQFWSTYTGLESEGQLLPPRQWTIHGLWPDFCNGSYTQYCDLNRQYDPVPSPNTTADGTLIPPYTGPGVDTFIEEFGRHDLLQYMNKFWINQGAPNANFWAHEFSKHATCYSTFDLPCFGPKYVEHEDVIQFFETVIKYYKRLPTYTWLAKAGITPSNSTTYTLSDMQDALSSQYGAVPYIGCSGPRYNTTSAGNGTTDGGRTVVSEVWYYQHVYGRPQDGNSVPLNATSPDTSCAESVGALHYYFRTPSSLQT